jgi:SpoVK/Ycf46/Vps4 family AAA+-type ATPase
MARADLLKQLITSHQRRDDPGFRTAVAAIIEEEEKKHHVVLARELQGLMANGVRTLHEAPGSIGGHAALPTDADRKTSLVNLRHTDRYLADIVLDDRLQSSLEHLLIELRGWDILQASGLEPTRKLLFCGPSGCGKTVTAEALATELGLPLLYVRFDGVVSSLLGETAANIRKVFDYASRGQWVVFFDEFDAVGRSRDDPSEHGEIKRVVNSFLQLLDGFQGRSLVIAATNFEQALDPAVWRRFDEVLRFELPAETALAELVRRKIRPLRFQPSHIRELVRALEGASFADAERVCLDIRKRRVLEGGDAVRKSDVIEAAERHRYRIGIRKRAEHDVHPPTIER